MCAPGLFITRMKWAFGVFLALGFVSFIVATVKNGGSKPETALALLIATNLSFWLSLGLAIVRMSIAGPSVLGGVDAFAGPAALWLYLLPPLILYEAVVFLKSLTANQERTTAVVGLVAVAAQVAVTMRFVYGMVQGV